MRLMYFFLQVYRSLLSGRVACCSLVSHVRYALHTVLRSEKDGIDGQTGGWTDVRPLHYALH